MTAVWVLAALVCTCMVASCGQSKEDIQNQVKVMLQNKIDTDKDFRKYKMRVTRVDLIAESDTQYTGMATIIFKGEENQLGVKVTTDGDTLMYQTDPFAFVARYELEKAGRELESLDD